MEEFKRIWNLFIYSIQNSFNVKGRACRMEVGAFIIIYFIFCFLSTFLITLSMFATFIPAIIADKEPSGLPVLIIVLFGLYFLTLLAMMPAWLTVGVRRLHDINLTGWIVLPLAIANMIPFVNMIGFIVTMYLYFGKKGDEGSNKYGLPSVNY